MAKQAIFLYARDEKVLAFSKLLQISLQFEMPGKDVTKNVSYIQNTSNDFQFKCFFPFSKPFSWFVDTKSSGKACSLPHKQLNPDLVTRHH